MDNLLETLAEIEHKQWIEWSKTVAKQETISKERLDRWESCWIPYKDLSEEMKEFDRVYARKIIEELKSQNLLEDESGGEMANNVGDGKLAGTTPDTMFRPSSFIGKTPVVKLPAKNFMKLRFGKIKHKRWDKFIENSGLANPIKQYMNKYPKQSLMAQCEDTGAMVYIRKVD